MAILGLSGSLPSSTVMNHSMTLTHREKFQTLLRKLFQFDCAELDFGIYRIMNHKRQAVEDFIQNDLLAAVAGELQRGALAQESGLAEALAETKKSILENVDEDAFDAEGNLAAEWHKSKLGKEYLDLQQRASFARGKPEVEAEIFNHLYTFFSRYYDSGDFMSLRRYSSREKYAIPYNGEEVHLHWANNDQYYIKTGENFTDYAYKHGAWTVRFALRNAEVEQNNVKGAKRFFLPQTEQLTVDEKAKCLTLPMHYRPLNEAEQALYAKKKKGGEDAEEDEDVTAEVATKGKGKTGIDGILADAVTALDRLTAKAPEGARSALNAEKRRAADGRPVPLIEHHLRFYTAKNSSDFFIHKDLGGFLARELDFYVKNDVLHVDELSEAGPARAESWFQIMRCLKGVGIRIITFLAQIENFQKRLFEKKKFVTEVNWCVTLDRVPESLYPEILQNKEQLKEWRELFHIHEIEGDLATPGYSEPLNAEFLKSQPFLVLDTRFFSQDFKDALLASKEFLGNAETIKEATNGCLFCSENFQAMNLVVSSYRNTAKSVYIDPPYNTTKDIFPYKDGYKHGTWLAMMHDRLIQSSRIMRADGVIFISIDQNEMEHLGLLCRMVFGTENFLGVIVWRNVRDNNPTRVATEHEYILCFCKDAAQVEPIWKNSFADSKELLMSEYERLKALKISPDNIQSHLRSFIKDNAEVLGEVDRYKFVDKDGVFTGSQSVHNPHSGGYNYDIEHPETKGMMRKPANGYRFPQSTMKRDYIAKNLLIYGEDENRIVQIKVYLKNYQDSLRSVIDLDGRLGAYALNALFGKGNDLFDNPKPPQLLKRLISFSSAPKMLVADFFAGSGTTAHAAIEVAEQSETSVEYLLVEMGLHFDTVLKPRLQKKIYSTDWKDGKPVSRAGSSHAFKYLRLESYEDALDNISFTDPQAPQSMLNFDDYTLGYMLDFETKESATFLNVAALDAPFDYQLKLHGQDKPQPVDLPETFNYLLGLHVASRRVLHRKKVRYLIFTGQVEGRSTAILWRTTRDWKKTDWEAEREWVEKEKLTAAAEDVWVNTDSFIPGARSLDPVFKKRMFNED